MRFSSVVYLFDCIDCTYFKKSKNEYFSEIWQCDFKLDTTDEPCQKYLQKCIIDDMTAGSRCVAI